MNRPVHALVKKYQKKAFTNIEKVKILHVLNNKVALLTRKRSERGTRNYRQIIFRKVWTMYIENVDQKINFYMTLMRLKLDFLFTDLSQNFGIYLVFAVK